MNKRKLRFYKGYEYFYKRLEKNEFFSTYCERVFGIDFSQDGFSDIGQITDLLKLADIKPDDKVLDIGCGNGKLAEYIADRTGATVYGFDYSKHAIRSAIKRVKGKERLIFETGLIGEKEYPADFFDVIIAVDTMYFAPDINQFVHQLYGWLKPGGVFLAFYGEGPFDEKSNHWEETQLAAALRTNNITYEGQDFTHRHYELMKRKRQVIEAMRDEFMNSSISFYYQASVAQSVDPNMPYEEFIKEHNRFLYSARKTRNT